MGVDIVRELRANRQPRKVPRDYIHGLAGRAADEIERLRTALYLADEGCNYTSLYNEAHEVAKIKADIAQKEGE